MTTAIDSFAAFSADCQQRVNRQLDNTLPLPEGAAARLNEAMRYAALNGGKRIRPQLGYAAALAIGEIDSNTDRVAAAAEMIHAYSLIHDDLPAMDDDELRRGKPTCHIAFDEATAILAGDGLQAQAFNCIAEIQLNNSRLVVELLNQLAQAAGPMGMVGGQAIDIAATGQQLTLDELAQMHSLKTGALINASILMGAIATGQATEQQLAQLTIYGERIGLAFQVQDDILDVTSSTDTLGKSQGADQHLNKPTYTSLLGLDKAITTANQLCDEAVDALSSFDQRADRLRDLARHIVSRQH